jgi:hypothetical protein
MWNYPAAIGEAATGIFFWPAWGLYDTIEGDKFKHINLSHDFPSPVTVFGPGVCPAFTTTNRTRKFPTAGSWELGSEISSKSSARLRDQSKVAPIA